MDKKTKSNIQSRFGWIKSYGIGRRTGRNIFAGKTIRKDKDGFDNIDDYFSESDADATFDLLERKKQSQSKAKATEKENIQDASGAHSSVSQSVPSQMSYFSLSSQDSNIQEFAQRTRSKLAWIRNPNIGRRTGKDVTAGKIITRDSEGFENFSDYLSESDAESFMTFSEKTRSHRQFVTQSSAVTSDAVETESQEDEEEDGGEKDMSVNHNLEIAPDGATSMGQLPGQETNNRDVEPETVPSVKNAEVGPSHLNETYDKHNSSVHSERKELNRTYDKETTVNTRHRSSRKSSLETRVKDKNDETDEPKARSIIEVVTEDSEQSEPSAVDETHAEASENEPGRISPPHVGDLEETHSRMDEEEIELEAEELNPTQPWEKEGIEAGGNKSGSITKKDVVVGSTGKVFNKTKKRLSYSALELSEKSKKNRQSRVKAANVELQNEETASLEKEITSTPLSSRTTVSQQEVEQNTCRVQDSESQASDWTVAAVKATEDTPSEGVFLSLTNRHQALPSPAVANDSGESDDEIVMLDVAEKTKSAQVKPVAKKSKRQSKLKSAKKENSKSLKKNQTVNETEKAEKSVKRTARKKKQNSIIEDVTDSVSSVASPGPQEIPLSTGVIDSDVAKSRKRKQTRQQQNNLSSSEQELSQSDKPKIRRSSSSGRSESGGSDSEKQVKQTDRKQKQRTKERKSMIGKDKSGKKGRSQRKTRTSKSAVDRSLDQCEATLTEARTPQANTSVPGPEVFASGVSFRVSRRSEMIESPHSEYTEPVPAVLMAATLGLTPCITKTKSRKSSKGRRVTICPEVDIEHQDAQILNGKSRQSLMSETPLPSFNSTPVHICETTNTNNSPDVDSGIITEKIIYPEPAPEGLRRSQRTRLRPVAWHKGERILWDTSNSSGPVIVGIQPSREAQYLKQDAEKRRRRQLHNAIRKAANSGSKKNKNGKWNRKLSVHASLPDDVVVGGNQDVTVINPDTQEETHVTCFGGADDFSPKGPHQRTPKATDPFLITVHLDLPIYKAGNLTLKPRAVKPTQVVTENGVVYHIIYGKLLVTIHKTTSMMESGASFAVPFGNTYSLENLRTDEAVLGFTVVKRMDDTDTPNTTI